MITAPVNRTGGSRGRDAFVRLAAFIAAVAALLHANPACATIRAGITQQNGRSSFDLVDAAGGSLSAEPRRFIPTTELGLDLPIGSNLQAGVFVNRTEFDTGVGIFRIVVLGGSIIRPVILGSQFILRLGVGLANGSGAYHSTIGVNEFVVVLPVPGIRGAGIALTHQILIDHSPFYPNFAVFHVNRIGMTIAML